MRFCPPGIHPNGHTRFLGEDNKNVILERIALCRALTMTGDRDSGQEQIQLACDRQEGVLQVYGLGKLTLFRGMRTSEP